MSTEEKTAVEGVGTNTTTNSSSTAITDHDNNLTLHKVSTSVLYYALVLNGQVLIFKVPSAVLSQVRFRSHMVKITR
jgi:hypothetical protein